MVTVKSFDGGEFDAYMVLPAGGYGPGIVVLQEIFGVNEFLRNVCDWYAAHGFVAICPDLFWRQERGVELTDQTEAGWQKAFGLYQGLDVGAAVEDSAAAVEFLRGHPPSASNLIAPLGITESASRKRSTKQAISARP
jgi:carboxymethylenebutenolidase